MQKIPFIFLILFSFILVLVESQPTTTPPATPIPWATTPAGYAIWRSFANSGTGSKWNPANITIGRGDIVLWEWSGGVHNIKGVGNNGTYPTICGVAEPSPPTFYSGLPDPRNSYSFTFTEPGTYYYICEPHCYDNMWGAITVLDSTTFPVNETTTEPPTTTPPTTTEPQSPSSSPSPTTSPPSTTTIATSSLTLPPAPAARTEEPIFDSWGESNLYFYDDVWFILLTIGLLN